MSKGPTKRHSKPPQPVTIDLDATDVTPKFESPTPKSGPATSVPITPDPKATPARPEAKEPEGAKSAGGVKAAAAASGSTSAMAGQSETGKTENRQSETAGQKATPAQDASGDKKTPEGPKTSQPASGGISSDAKAKERASATGGGASSSAPSASSSRGGGLGMAASGLIGAVIALGAGYALQAGGILPAPGASGGEQVQALNGRLDAMAGDVQALTDRLASSASTEGADLSAQLAARLDNLESSLADATAGGADATASSELAERLAALEDRVGAIGEGGGSADPGMAAGLSEVRAAQEGMQSALEEQKSATSSEIADLAARIEAIEASQSEISQRLDEPGRQVDLARAIAAAGLKSAIDRGGSFMTELEAFASVAPDDPAVPELRDLAASGVPSRSRLIEEFPDAASAAIAAADPVDPGAGLVNRLMSSALSVVKVRQVGEVEGESAEAIVARAEARLMDGDLDAALAEWNSLPEASRAATSDYGEALAARARAEKLIAASMAPAGAAASSEAPAN